MATENTTSDAAPPQIYTRAEVAKHVSADDLWVVIHRKVYNLSSFLLKHPGGGEILIEVAGEDVTESFEDLGHSSYARKMMVDYEIGEVEDEPVEPVVDKTSAFWRPWLIPIALGVLATLVYRYFIKAH
ncbi:cytochrome b5 isoform X2 [Lasioglossum baleicum]|uniref:cytochrome b5 isoform X2 n=1 Tax=Lasioglossum baleicum TaxID=434251 RepID=UPI003FCE08F4